MLTVLVPTRGRPHVIRDVVEAVASTKTRDDTELWFGVDESDPELDAYHAAIQGQPEWAYLTATPSTSMVECLNELVLVVAGSNGELPTAWMFMGDDHRPRTSGWDATLLHAATAELGPGLAYGNDLLQGENLPTQVCIDARIVARLGYMAPPSLTHLYVDNYWRQLGLRASCLHYCPSVVIEHLHPVAGKAAWDEGYKRVNDGTMYERDARAFEELTTGGVIDADASDVVDLRRQVMGA